MSGNKKKPAKRIDPDAAAVKESFQQNYRMASDIQKKHKSNTVERADMAEPYYSRRQKAVLNLLPEMKKRYQEKYPEQNIVREFAEVSSMPVLTYEMIDRQSCIALGATIWMLDRLREEGELKAACDYLPEDYEGVVDFQVYDPCFSDEIVKKMLYLIQNRYGESNRKIVPANILEKRETDDAFHRILDLLPTNAVDTAVEHLKEKFWQWVDLYFEAIDPLAVKQRKLNGKMADFGRQVEELKKKKPLPKKTLPLSAPLNVLNVGMPADASWKPEEDPKKALLLKMKEAEIEKNRIQKSLTDLYFASLHAGISGKKELVAGVGQEAAEGMYNFPIEDPYEICFAIIYLLDLDDDYAWIYSFTGAIVCRAAVMLPWGFTQYTEQDDGFWFNDWELIPSQPIDPEWYETKYAGNPNIDEEDEEAEEPHDMSLAQIVYENTGAILPRDMSRYDGIKKELKKKGLKPMQTAVLCGVMSVLGETSRRRDFYSEPVEETQEPSVDVAAVTAENEQLKKELVRLREQAKTENYNVVKENRELKEKLETVERASEEMTLELADLREIVFSRQTDAPEEKPEETTVAFPYHTSRRLVAFGGHDSWLREIKFKVPDVRFLGEDIPSPEVIKRADVVWIQTNCIGHKSYYGIIDLARRYERKVRYFKYASATKCALQVVEEEQSVE